jgi:CP family cyanate transporter-like MFS transporter
MDPGTAGWMLSFSAFPGILASLVTPVVPQRVRPTWLPVAVAVALTGVAYLGFGVMPLAGSYLWMTMLGLGQGASISLSLTYIVWRSPDTHHTGQLSTMSQGFGYLLAGLGPLGIGAAHSLTGSWTVPLSILGLLLLVQLGFGTWASRPVHVGRE